MQQLDEPKSPEVRELQEELSSLNSLKKHPGYQYLISVAEGQIASRMQGLILTPLKTMDEVLEQEYKKGEVGGVMLFKEIVDIQIKALEDEIQSKLEELENVNENADE